MTNNRTTELLPCPFCCGEAFPNIEGRGKHWIECRKCGSESDCYATEADAIAAWNTRTPEQAVAATLGSEREKALEELVQDWQVLYEYPDYGDCIRLRKRMQELGIEVIDE